MVFWLPVCLCTKCVPGTREGPNSVSDLSRNNTSNSGCTILVTHVLFINYLHDKGFFYVDSCFVVLYSGYTNDICF